MIPKHSSKKLRKITAISLVLLVLIAVTYVLLALINNIGEISNSNSENYQAIEYLGVTMSIEDFKIAFVGENPTMITPPSIYTSQLDFSSVQIYGSYVFFDLDLTIGSQVTVLPIQQGLSYRPHARIYILAPSGLLHLFEIEMPSYFEHLQAKDFEQITDLRDLLWPRFVPFEVTIHEGTIENWKYFGLYDYLDFDGDFLIVQ